MSGRARRAQNGRSGQAMVMALLAIAFLTVVIGSATVMLRAHSRMIRHEHNSLVSHYMARSGLETAMMLLGRDDPSSVTLADAWSVAGDILEQELQTGTFGLGSPPGTEGEPEPGIVDEERKLNVNVVSPAMLGALMPGLDEETLGRIVSRRDERPFATVREFVEFAGPGVVPAEEMGEVRPDGLLTVHGRGRINVNTAPAAVLESVEGISREDAQLMVERRAGAEGAGGLEVLRDLLEVDGEAWARIEEWVGERSSYFTVRSWGASASRPVAYEKLQVVLRRTDEGLAVIDWREGGL